MRLLFLQILLNKFLTGRQQSFPLDRRRCSPFS
ncbi:hypothetical protein BCAR13_80112 [Paraburkholderia caribensis]|nr:hypothetical protein BCAR13_80112 [Paraburkholderia caribensis]